eukprot:UN30491
MTGANCEGSWSECTSACEPSEYRTFLTEVEPWGDGDSCPNSIGDCNINEGDCQKQLCYTTIDWSLILGMLRFESCAEFITNNNRFNSYCDCFHEFQNNPTTDIGVYNLTCYQYPTSIITLWEVIEMCQKGITRHNNCTYLHNYGCRGEFIGGINNVSRNDCIGLCKSTTDCGCIQNVPYVDWFDCQLYKNQTYFLRDDDVYALVT